MAKRRTFTSEFKTEAVRQVTEGKRSVAEVADGLGLRDTLLRRWVHEFQTQPEQAFPGHGQLSPLEEELRRLRLENKRLQADCDILKKATAYFAKELR
jgi:transposase